MSEHKCSVCGFYFHPDDLTAFRPDAMGEVFNLCKRCVRGVSEAARRAGRAEGLREGARAVTEQMHAISNYYKHAPPDRKQIDCAMDELADELLARAEEVERG